MCAKRACIDSTTVVDLFDDLSLSRLLSRVFAPAKECQDPAYYNDRTGRQQRPARCPVGLDTNVRCPLRVKTWTSGNARKGSALGQNRK